jgi:hypothetical protein
MKEYAIDTRCGLICATCTFKEKFNCGGCIKTDGHPFHGDCAVAVCCQNKGFLFCGLCPDFPCQLLHDYSYDPDHGDNGARIEQCRRWAKL